MTTTSPDDRPTLGSTGPIEVSDRAAREYARAVPTLYADEHDEPGISEARRELHELLLDAKRVVGDTETPERWRLRSRERGVDISARVVTDGRLRVVVSISARPVLAGGGASRMGAGARARKEAKRAARAKGGGSDG